MKRFLNSPNKENFFRKLEFISWMKTILGNSVNLSVGLLTGIVLARSLGPEGRGLIASLLLWPNLLAPIGLLGVNDALIYLIGKEPGKVSTLLSSCLYLLIIMSMIVILVSMIVLPVFMGELYRNNSNVIDMYITILIPFYFFLMTMLSYLQAIKNYNLYNIFQVLTPLLYLIFLVALWELDILNAETAVYSSLSGVVVSSSIIFYKAISNINNIPSFLYCKNLLKIGSRFHIPTAFTLLANQLDKIYIVKYFDKLSVGYYVIAYTFSTVCLNAISNATYTVMFPFIAKEENIENKISYLKKGLIFSSLILGIVTILMYFLADLVIPFLFGEKYEQSVSISKILIISSYLFSIKQVIIKCLKGFGVSIYSGFSEVISIIIFLAIVFPLADLYKVSGVCFSLLVSNLITTIYLISVVAFSKSIRVN